MKSLQKQGDVVRELTMFALRRRRACFEGWEPPLVFKYLAWHLLAGTLGIVREGRALLGVGIAYSASMEHIVEHEGKAFDWKLPERGNVLYLEEVIAVRRAIPRLLEMAMNRYPWINRIMTLRRGKLVELRLSALTRLAT